MNEDSEQSLFTEFKEMLNNMKSSDSVLLERANFSFDFFLKQKLSETLFFCHQILKEQRPEDISILDAALLTLNKALKPSYNNPKDHITNVWKSLDNEFQLALSQLCDSLYINGPPEHENEIMDIILSLFYLGFPQSDDYLSFIGQAISNDSEDPNVKRKYVNLIQFITEHDAPISYESVSMIHDTLMSFLHTTLFDSSDVSRFILTIDAIYSKNYSEYNKIETTNNFVECLKYWIFNSSDEGIYNTAFHVFVSFFQRSYGNSYFPYDLFQDLITNCLQSDNEQINIKCLNSILQCVNFEVQIKADADKEKNYYSSLKSIYNKSPTLYKKYSLPYSAKPFANFFPKYFEENYGMFFEMIFLIPDDLNEVIDETLEDLPIFMLSYSIIRQIALIDNNLVFDKITELFHREKKSDNWKDVYIDSLAISIASFLEGHYNIYRENQDFLMENLQNEKDVIVYQCLISLYNYTKMYPQMFQQKDKIDFCRTMFEIMTSYTERNPQFILLAAHIMNNVFCDYKFEGTRSEHIDFVDSVLHFSIDCEANLQNSLDVVESVHSLVISTLRAICVFEMINDYLTSVIDHFQELLQADIDTDHSLLMVRDEYINFAVKLSEKMRFIGHEQLIEIIKLILPYLSDIDPNRDLLNILYIFLKTLLPLDRKQFLPQIVNLRDRAYSSGDPVYMQRGSFISALVTSIRISDEDYTEEESIAELERLLSPLMDENCREDAYPYILESLVNYLQSFIPYCAKNPDWDADARQRKLMRFMMSHRHANRDKEDISSDDEDKQEDHKNSKEIPPNADDSLEIPDPILRNLPDACYELIFQAFDKVLAFDICEDDEFADLSNSIIYYLLRAYDALLMINQSNSDFFKKNMRKIFALPTRISQYSSFSDSTLDAYIDLFEHAKRFASSNLERIFLQQKNLIRPLIFAMTSDDKNRYDKAHSALMFK